MPMLINADVDADDDADVDGDELDDAKPPTLVALTSASSSLCMNSVLNAVQHTTTAGQSPLHLACLRGCMPVVRFLLDHGANAEATDASGRTPLLMACDALAEVSSCRTLCLLW